MVKRTPQCSSNLPLSVTIYIAHNTGLDARQRITALLTIHRNLKQPNHIFCALQGLLDTKTPLLVLLASNSVNFCLDILLIFGSASLNIPAYGAPGAAAATVVAGAMPSLQPPPASSRIMLFKICLDISPVSL